MPLIKFVTNASLPRGRFGPNNKLEVDDATAAELVRQGIAEVVEPDKPAEVRVETRHVSLDKGTPDAPAEPEATDAGVETTTQPNKRASVRDGDGPTASAMTTRGKKDR